MEGGYSCPKLKGQGRQGTRLNGNLASSEGEEGAMALTITVEQTSAILTQELQRGMQKRPPTWSDGKSGNPSVLWAETALEDRPGCNSIHENWQVPSQEILNATTRLERIRALGGWEAANPHCRLTQDLLGMAC